jgi:DNA ligase-1
MTRLSGTVEPQTAVAPKRTTKKRVHEDGEFECTLAKKWTNEDPNGYYISEKLDGMRCLWDGSILRTRTGNAIFAPEVLIAELPTLPLDGELFLGRSMFQNCMSVVRSQNADMKAWKDIRFMVFDSPSTRRPFSDRLDAAKEALRGCSWAEVHEHSLCTGCEHVLQELDLVMQKGGEGVMLRNASSLYIGGRSTDLLKVKKFYDAEAVVIGHERGKRRNVARLGALLCMDDSGKRFKIGTGFKDSERKVPPRIGTRVTYKYQEKTKAGLPRFPVYKRVRCPE